MSKYRRSHNSSHHERAANSLQHCEETKQSDALLFALHREVMKKKGKGTGCFYGKTYSINVYIYDI